jgi:cytochrome c553
MLEYIFATARASPRPTDQLSLAQVPDMAALPAIREIGDRLDGKPKQEAEVTLRQAIARELSDDDLAAIAVGGEDEKIQQDPKPASSKLN